MTMSFAKLILIVFVLLLFFGAGRLPRLMSDVGRSIRALKDGLKDEKKPSIPEDTASLTTRPSDDV
ncbi:MAG: twin-arginine translocase TatA/TatE family subunit [Alphaproteobacteria bacterium]|nr:MAG: twin-arginine translocase TatA/TatE family subunit [Alphaproteobacteria bacterium]